jgi:hypothetical protein
MRFGLARERIAAVGRGDGDCRLLGTAVPALLVLREHVIRQSSPVFTRRPVPRRRQPGPQPTSTTNTVDSACSRSFRELGIAA